MNGNKAMDIYARRDYGRFGYERARMVSVLKFAEHIKHSLW